MPDPKVYRPTVTLLEFSVTRIAGPFMAPTVPRMSVMSRCRMRVDASVFSRESLTRTADLTLRQPRSMPLTMPPTTPPSAAVSRGR